MKGILYVITGCLVLSLVSAGDGTYTYDNVDEWDTLFPDYCAGTRQSPIDINTEVTEYKNYCDLVLGGFDESTGVTQTLVNTGHTVQLDVTGDYTVSGAGLAYLYHTAQLHFHWGSIDTQGSEHTYNGKEYPAEMHIVNVRDGLSLSEALQRGDGIAVLGIQMEVTDGADNSDFAPIIDAMGRLDEVDVEKSVNPTVVLSHLLPDDITNFFRYEGSLTTPGCNEAVIWTVFEKSITISRSQMDVFRTLIDNQNHTIVDNYRPPQPLNNRMLYRSFDSDTSGVSGVFCTMASILAAVIVIRLFT